LLVNAPYTSSVKRAPQIKYAGTPKTIKEAAERESYANTSVDSFTFQGTKHKVKYWKDVLIGISQIVLDRHRDQFDLVLSLVGRKRPYFTKDPNELRVPERIDETDIFVEINVSANRMVKLARQIIALFGYSKDDLSFDFKLKKSEASSTVS
jgi:hypothetical protein